MVAAVLLLAMSCNIAHLAGGAYRRDFYFCPVCNEKEKQKIALSAAASSFRKTLPSRPGHMANKRW